MKGLRIGFLGGTFDPVHLGHVQLAEIALAEMRLDKLVFVPSAFPPHKNDDSVLHFDQRVEMLELVCRAHPKFEWSDVERHLASPSYLIHTLEELQKKYCHGHDCFFILGSDAFLDMTNWMLYRRILQQIHLILVKRRGGSEDEIEHFLEALGYTETKNGWQVAFSGKSIFSLEALPDRISSTEIRKCLRQDDFETIQDKLPVSVSRHLRSHMVYRMAKED